VLISWRSVQEHVKEFFFFLLLLETGTVGVFAAVDLFLFYVFWEITLVPMYFLIGIWGHERRIYAALKFFLFTVVGSLLMLVGIIWLYTVFGTCRLHGIDPWPYTRDVLEKLAGGCRGGNSLKVCRKRITAAPPCCIRGARESTQSQ